MLQLLMLLNYVIYNHVHKNTHLQIICMKAFLQEWSFYLLQTNNIQTYNSSGKNSQEQFRVSFCPFYRGPLNLRVSSWMCSYEHVCPPASLSQAFHLLVLYVTCWCWVPPVVLYGLCHEFACRLVLGPVFHLTLSTKKVQTNRFINNNKILNK